jgi:phage anti-repressor protein
MLLNLKIKTWIVNWISKKIFKKAANFIYSFNNNNKRQIKHKHDISINTKLHLI